jgi:hypothetical protein
VCPPAIFLHVRHNSLLHIGLDCCLSAQIAMLLFPIAEFRLVIFVMKALDTVSALAAAVLRLVHFLVVNPFSHERFGVE